MGAQRVCRAQWQTHLGTHGKEGKNEYWAYRGDTHNIDAAHKRRDRELIRKADLMLSMDLLEEFLQLLRKSVSQSEAASNISPFPKEVNGRSAGCSPALSLQWGPERWRVSTIFPYADCSSLYPQCA